jgi:hypothetical protein
MSDKELVAPTKADVRDIVEQVASFKKDVLKLADEMERSAELNHNERCSGGDWRESDCCKYIGILIDRVRGYFHK